MVIDIANVRDVRTKIRDNFSDLSSGCGRIDGMHTQTYAASHGLVPLEIDVWNKMTVVGGGWPALVGHGEQRDFVPPRAHQFHAFKQVGFGPAEPEVVLVAVQNSHGSLFLVARVPTDQFRRRVSENTQ